MLALSSSSLDCQRHRIWTCLFWEVYFPPYLVPLCVTLENMHPVPYTSFPLSITNVSMSAVYHKSEYASCVSQSE